MSFLLSILSIAVALVVLSIRGFRKKAQVAALSWDQLIAQLEAVPTEAITKVAIDYLLPRKSQFAVDVDEMWSLIGKEEGLRRMQANAEVLIALAAFASQWSFEESALVAGRMRRDGMALRQAVQKIALDMAIDTGKATGTLYLQEAASKYWLMRERLLALYKTSHGGRYPRLAAAL